MFRGRCKCSYCKYLRAIWVVTEDETVSFSQIFILFHFIQKEGENSEGKIWNLVWIPGQKREKENKKH